MVRETGIGAERIRTIRNGVDLSRFGLIERSAARRTLGLPLDALVVGTVGRLVPVKAHRTLIEAAARLRSADGRVRVVIAGEGPLRGDLERQIVALGLHDRVELLGHRADVEVVLGSCDVFVLPSASEGLCNTILEAMASRLPVVATQVGGADEMVIPGETGWLVPPGSPSALAAAIAAALSDANRARVMGNAGRARAECLFSLDEMIARYDSLYVQAMATRRRASFPTAAGVSNPERPEHATSVGTRDGVANARKLRHVVPE
jgi:glycosyltransferase involved in cell wall biosynthesis